MRACLTPGLKTNFVRRRHEREQADDAINIKEPEVHPPAFSFGGLQFGALRIAVVRGAANNATILRGPHKKDGPCIENH